MLHRDPKPYDGPILKPQPGQIYVQVGAYSPNYTGSFLTILEKKGFHGMVAPGPSQDVNRVLVGPFPDPSVVKNTHGELEKAGLNELREGDKVSFDVVANRGKDSAENLKVK